MQKWRKKRKKMDSGGLSWADQWDYHNDPPPSSSGNDKRKNKDGSNSKSKFGKTLLSFKWMKELRKKSQKQWRPTEFHLSQFFYLHLNIHVITWFCHFNLILPIKFLHFFTWEPKTVNHSIYIHIHTFFNMFFWISCLVFWTSRLRRQMLWKQNTLFLNSNAVCGRW